MNTISLHQDKFFKDVSILIPMKLKIVSNEGFEIYTSSNIAVLFISFLCIEIYWQKKALTLQSERFQIIFMFF